MTTNGGASWLNRIVGEGAEAPDQLLANPFNARVHPQYQQDALAGVLDSVGWVDRVIVNRLTGHIVDGHLRVMLALKRDEAQVPVQYVELSEDEEKLVLATFDPITNLAAYDRDVLDTLLREVNSDSPAIQQMLSELAAENNPLVYGDGERGGTPDERLDIFLNATIKQIVLYFANAEYGDVIERLAVIRDALELENHTEVFIKLLEHYENTPR